jgi:hypothetical protein
LVPGLTQLTGSFFGAMFQGMETQNSCELGVLCSVFAELLWHLWHRLSLLSEAFMDAALPQNYKKKSYSGSCHGVLRGRT